MLLSVRKMLKMCLKIVSILLVCFIMTSVQVLDDMWRGFPLQTFLLWSNKHAKEPSGLTK